MMINFNPTVAFRVTDDVYAGAGLDLYYSKLELKAVGAIAPPPFPPPTYLADGEGEGIGLGANFGITWLPTDQQRVTFTYRSETEIEYEGDFSSPLPNNGNFGVTIKYPNIIGVGYGIMLSDDIEIEALFEWLEWSSNDSQTLDAGGSPVTVVNNWDDTITFGFGGSWQVNESIVARAGYAYLPTPIPDGTITPLLPDADRHAISFGLGYTAGAHTVDLAYTVSIYDDRSAPITGAGPGTYEIDSNLIGLTYSLSF